MEVYSTTLWHLQKDVALSTLAQDLVEIDRASAQVNFKRNHVLELDDCFLIFSKDGNEKNQS